MDVYNIPSKDSWNLNIDFWGSILGTVATIVGVYWTLEYEKEKTREENRLAIKPFFQYEFDIGLYPFREIQSKHRNILDYEVDLSDTEDDVVNLVVPMRITNIGLGHGIIVKDIPVLVNGKKVTAARQGKIRTKLIRLESENIFLIKVYNISKAKLEKLKVTIVYTDLNELHRYSDTLIIGNQRNITNNKSLVKKIIQIFKMVSGYGLY